jgi:hypothetical protein
VKKIPQFVRQTGNVGWEKLAHAQKGMTAVGKKGYDCMHEGRIYHGIEPLRD